MPVFATLTFAEFLSYINGVRPDGEGSEEAVLMSLDQMIIRHIARVLTKTKGKVEGLEGAAEILNAPPNPAKANEKVGHSLWTPGKGQVLKPHKITSDLGGQTILQLLLPKQTTDGRSACPNVPFHPCHFRPGRI